MRDVLPDPIHAATSGTSKNLERVTQSTFMESWRCTVLRTVVLLFVMTCNGSSTYSAYDVFHVESTILRPQLFTIQKNSNAFSTSESLAHLRFARYRHA